MPFVRAMTRVRNTPVTLQLRACLCTQPECQRKTLLWPLAICRDPGNARFVEVRFAEVRLAEVRLAKVRAWQY